MQESSKSEGLLHKMWNNFRKYDIAGNTKNLLKLHKTKSLQLRWTKYHTSNGESHNDIWRTCERVRERIMVMAKLIEIENDKNNTKSLKHYKKSLSSKWVSSKDSPNET